MISIFYQNCNGLRTKCSTFFSNLLGCNYDIICLSETWLNDSCMNCNYFTDEYYIFRKDKLGPNPDRDVRGGGTLIAVNKRFKVHRRFDLDFQNIECTWIELDLGHGSNLIIGNNYFNPTIQTELLQNYVNFLESSNIDVASSKILLVGDYNIPKFNFTLGVSENDSSYIRNKSDIVYSLLCSFDLVQSNFERILAEDNILDLVCSNFADCLKITKESGLVNWDHSHPALLIDIRLPVFLSNFVPLVKRDYAKGDYLGLYNYISRYQIVDSEDPNVLVKDLTDTVVGAIQSFIPNKVICPSKYPRWFSRKLINFLKLKEKFHKKSRRQPNNGYYRYFFYKYRTLSKKTLWADELRYKRKVEADLRVNPKFFWQYIKTQYKNQHEVSLVQNGAVVPVAQTPELFANHFSSIYSSADSNARYDLVCNSSQVGSNIVVPPTVTVGDVIKASKSLKPSQTAGSDGIPSFIVKGCINVLAPILCIIFNQCLKLGIFPLHWKTSIVVPVPKNGNVNLVQNYRPISLLSNFSKLFEKIIMNHVMFNVKSQLSPDQHGFLSGRSTVTNLASFLQFAGTVVLDRRQVDTAYFDLSKAFDVVNHTLLIIKLQKFGLSPLFANFFQSYLQSRQFKVKVGNFFSSCHNIPSGVPQGSNLGPLLFIIFFDDIKNVISSNFQIFADDLKISRAINDPNDHAILQNDINSVTLWCSENGMQCNTDKTVIVTYSRQHVVNYHTYKINNAFIRRKHVHKDLGILFDNKLNFDNHVQKMISNAKRSSGVVFWATKTFRNPSSYSVLFSALVRSKLEYCSEVWGGVGDVTSGKIEQVQKNFLRKISFRALGFSTSYSNSLQTYGLTWLEARRNYKDIMLIYKLLNNITDCDFLSSQIVFSIPSLRRSRRRQHIPFRTIPSNIIPIPRVLSFCNSHPDLDYAQLESVFISNLKRLLFEIVP